MSTATTASLVSDVSDPNPTFQSTEAICQTHPPSPPHPILPLQKSQKGHMLVHGHLEVLLAHHLHANYPLLRIIQT